MEQDESKLSHFERSSSEPCARLPVAKPEATATLTVPEVANCDRSILQRSAKLDKRCLPVYRFSRNVIAIGVTIACVAGKFCCLEIEFAALGLDKPFGEA